MSLKEKVVLWQAGVENAEAGKFEDAIDNFTEIPEPSSRIYFNIASAFLRQGNLEDAERVSPTHLLSNYIHCPLCLCFFWKFHFACVFRTESGPVCEERPTHGAGLLPEGLPLSAETKVSKRKKLSFLWKPCDCFCSLTTGVAAQFQLSKLRGC